MTAMMTLQEQNISDNNFESCIKCTICTVYCPVTAVNPDYPGPKQAGPDGERYRLKKPFFYDEALKYCLNCKRCEVACPNNVRIADLIQSARLKYGHGRPGLRDTMLSNTDFCGTLATTFAPIANFALKLKPVKFIMDRTMGIDDKRTFPKYASQRFESWFRKNAEAEQEGFSRYITYFHGCYVNYNYPQLGKDLVKVLNAMGVGVRLLEKERCCGVAKIANRCVNEATRDAKINLQSIREAVGNGDDVIATSSTCCFTMRDEYPHVLKLDNHDVRDHIMLATRYIYKLLERGEAKLVFRDDFHKRVAYHVPCHMEKLGWTLYSEDLMKSIPGLEYVPLISHCCGIAGTYGFKKEYYDYSQAIGQELFDDIRRNNPDIVASDCETCKWQIEMSTGYTVMNPVSLLAEAIDVDATKAANGVG